jgi:hypothetical protein
MWNQPYFNMPPQSNGGYILVPVGGPTSPTNLTDKPKSLKRALKQAIRDRETIDETIKLLQEKSKGKHGKKPSEGSPFNYVYASMLMMLSAPFLGLAELYGLKMMLSYITATP